MPAPQHVDRETFLANLRHSGLVTEAQLAAVADKLPDTHRGRLVARTLVELGLLTKFQAEMLLAGRTAGFTLGQYRVLDQLGQGGMGRVFKALHLTMNRVVALKVLAPQFVETEKAQRLFRREMQAAARLSHPNIVTAHDASLVGDRCYLVMEYVDGPNFDRLVRDNGPLPVGQACDLIRQAALGLQHAHELGMVHRDIKPANLLVQRPSLAAPDRPWTVKVVDFGLARLGDSDAASNLLARSNVVLGTPDFVSPEQARDLAAADIRSDLYGLGCTFYYLLTGQVPFAGGNTLEKLVRHSSVDPDPVESLRPDIPPAVSAVVSRLLAKKPADRFQTPAELAAVLAPFSGGGPAQWKAPGSSPDLSLLDGLTGGFPDAGSDLGRQFAAFDEIAALAGTFPPALAPTTLSANRMTRPFATPRERRRLRFAVGLAVVIVLGLLGLAGLLSLVLPGG
jgi:eukaryotic-like serine/threonine-protein kinase